MSDQTIKPKRRIENKSSRTAAYTCTCRASSFLEKDSRLKSDDYISVQLLPRFVKVLLQLKILNLQGLISPKGIYPYVIARTKYFDRSFEDAIKNGIEQVVILGAGYDSRSIRLLCPDDKVEVYEIDTSHTLESKVLQFKKRKIAVPGNTNYLNIDFNKETLKTRLEKSKFDGSKKTLFILEGLTMYLSSEAIDETFQFIDEFSAPGSLIVFDYVHASVLRHEQKYFGEKAIYKRVKKDHETWTFGIDKEKIDQFLTTYHFQTEEHLDSESLENRYFKNESGRLLTRVNGTHCIVFAKKAAS